MLEHYLHDTVRPRVRQRLYRFGSQLPGPCDCRAVFPEPVLTPGRPVLLHTDLYQENVPFSTDGRPVFLDPLPMLGDPAFDCAFFVIYFDLARDPVTRLHMASQASGIEVHALVSWCLPLCLDGLLYYHDVRDDRGSCPAAGVNDNGRRFLQELPTQRRKDYARVCSSIAYREDPCRD
jgi:streptomycin 6-kinase